jgi:hypothetical protein
MRKVVHFHSKNNEVHRVVDKAFKPFTERSPQRTSAGRGWPRGVASWPSPESPRVVTLRGRGGCPGSRAWPLRGDPGATGRGRISGFQEFRFLPRPCFPQGPAERCGKGQGIGECLVSCGDLPFSANLPSVQIKTATRRPPCTGCTKNGVGADRVQRSAV